MLEINSFKICEKSFTLNQHYLKTPFQELNLFLEGVVLFISIPFKYFLFLAYNRLPSNSYAHPFFKHLRVACQKLNKKQTFLYSHLNTKYKQGVPRNMTVGK